MRLSFQNVPDSARIAVETQNLCRFYGKLAALDRVTLNIRKGEFFSLLGPSGCGKTTLLRLIAGLDFPDSGTLLLEERDVKQWPAYQRPVNTVFQSYALFPHMTVRENVAFGLKMKKVDTGSMHSRVAQAVELVQIGELLDRHPHQLSGGQKQRVALARAIVNEPKILLLDEPLGALDLKLRKQLQLELHQLQRRLGITFIYVTHDQDEALTMSDRIAVMNSGRVEQIGSPEELYENPGTRFVAQFLGSCNLLNGRWISEDRVETSLGTVSVYAPQSKTIGRAGDSVTLAIRPEKITFQECSPGKNNNTAEARVEDVIYSGAETNYLLKSGSTGLRVCLLNSVGHQRFAIGQSVTIQLPPEALVILQD